MKQFVRCGILIACAFLAITYASAQDADQKRERRISIKLKSGETLTGNLVKVDMESVDFTFKNALQTVSLDDVDSISFVTPTSKLNDDPSIPPMTADLKPTILYREKAKYTEEARNNGVQGTVSLTVVAGVSTVTPSRLIRRPRLVILHDDVENLLRRHALVPEDGDGRVADGELVADVGLFSCDTGGRYNLSSAIRPLQTDKSDLISS